MKIKLTEGQLRRLHNINEGADNRYNRVVKLDFSIMGNSHVGYEINDILSQEVRVSYDIDIEARSWGIKNMSLYGITGPSEIELEVEVFTNEEGDYETKMFPIRLDWENAKIETETGKGIVTVGDVIEVWLLWDEQGGLYVKEMNVPVYSL